MPPRRRTPYNTRFTPQGDLIPRRREPDARDVADDVADVNPDDPTPQEGQKDDDTDQDSER